MKAWIAGGVVVALIIVGVLVMMRDQEEVSQAPEETVSPPLVDESDVGAGFVQLAPDVSPEAADTPVEQTAPASGTSAAPAQSAAAAVISFSDTGATPRDVTVRSGGTVRFVNNGQVPRWPASDVHPTHEALPGFDSGRGLQTGESYSYAFETRGTWGWHDHLHPNVTGTVTVTE